MQKPFEAGRPEGRARLASLLRATMIRAAKSAIRDIPKCTRKVSCDGQWHQIVGFPKCTRAGQKPLCSFAQLQSGMKPCPVKKDDVVCAGDTCLTPVQGFRCPRAGDDAGLRGGARAQLQRAGALHLGHF